MSSPSSFRFSFGPWNISEGADPFGPNTRTAFPHEQKFALYRELGFETLSVRKRYYKGGVDALTMKLVVPAAKPGFA